MIADRAAFVRANTRVSSAPHVPELKLHLADDAVALWEMTEEELGAIGLPPPFWAFAWAGGQALARYVLDHPQTVAGRSVLDVASGCGIVGIAAARVGAAHVTCADLDVFAADAALLNASLNGVRIQVETGDALARPPSAQVVLVGDLFYERDLAGRLIEWLEAAVARGATALIGDPGRSYLPQDRLEAIATYEVPVSRALEDAEVKRTRVWRLRSAGAVTDA